MAESFNPLDRGNLNQIKLMILPLVLWKRSCFNPLDRGNLNQMTSTEWPYPCGE